MKFRLKNKDLQVQLDALSGGDFSRRLDELMTGEPVNLWANMCGAKTVQITFGETREFSVRIPVDDIEEVHEYDPHGWNDFPEVEPPEDVWMRVERCVDGRTYHFAARYVPVGDSEDYEWLSEANLSIDVDRFRPWDDPDGEEDKE
jgi:hypothetical protein|nr:MAG TPA: hypothetical protein [Caudoviricetes sp.]